MIRFYPAAPYSLQFGLPESADSFSATIRLPAMIFAGVGKTYFVWAVKEEQFTTASHLFAVPLSNIWSDGCICYGANMPPAVSAEDWQTIDEAWQLFIGSPFIGDLASGKSRTQPEDVRLQLLAVSRSQDQQYPLDDLLAHTLNDTPITVQMAVDAMLRIANRP